MTLGLFTAEIKCLLYIQVLKEEVAETNGDIDVSPNQCLVIFLRWFPKQIRRTKSFLLTATKAILRKKSKRSFKVTFTIINTTHVS